MEDALTSDCVSSLWWVTWDLPLPLQGRYRCLSKYFQYKITFIQVEFLLLKWFWLLILYFIWYRTVYRFLTIWSCLCENTKRAISNVFNILEILAQGCSFQQSIGQQLTWTPDLSEFWHPWEAKRVHHTSTSYRNIFMCPK